MRIVLVNKYYHMKGGAERYMFNILEHLQDIGHEVIPFSVAYPKNIPSKHAEYFPMPAGGGMETKLDQLEGGIGTKLRIASRSVYSFDAKNALERLIKDTKPDIVYCLNIVNHLSPSVIDAASKYRLPVVMRLSDYYLVCPNYLFLRDGKVCMECERGYYHALRHKCIYDSLTATACRVAGMYVHKMIGVYRKVGAFITTTDFMRDTLVRVGFPADKIHVIRTFVDSSNWTPRYDNDGYILFFGRLAKEKGIEFLLDAYADSGVKNDLLIAGEGPEEYVAQLRSRIPQELRDNVHFLGRKSGDELKSIVGGACYVVVPSVWHDNAPNVIYEAFASGKPIIGTDLGGIREQVDADTGILVESGNACQLSAAIRRLSSDQAEVSRLGHNARQLVEREHTVDVHSKRLLGVFHQLTRE